MPQPGPRAIDTYGVAIAALYQDSAATAQNRTLLRIATAQALLEIEQLNQDQNEKLDLVCTKLDEIKQVLIDMPGPP